MSIPETDTRHLFRPLGGEIVELLRTLAGHDWERSTMAGTWRVRDVVAHLLDTALRRLSFQRDRLIPPAGAGPAAIGGDLVVFINTLNATWIRAAERLSSCVRTDSYARASTAIVDFHDTANPQAADALSLFW